ncbi:MAG: hypothetical protein IBJ10_06700 [Phycisphaerales bacterium]|nr:hypothetical protein [Phycisphaerales bacterium]
MSRSRIIVSSIVFLLAAVASLRGNDPIGGVGCWRCGSTTGLWSGTRGLSCASIIDLLIVDGNWFKPPTQAGCINAKDKPCDPNDEINWKCCVSGSTAYWACVQRYTFDCQSLRRCDSRCCPTGTATLVQSIKPGCNQNQVSLTCLGAR